MKRVLDSSVGFKWFVPELHSDKALRLRDDYRTGILELIAPDIFLIEFAHALTRAERQKRISPSPRSARLGRYDEHAAATHRLHSFASSGLSDFVA